MGWNAGYTIMEQTIIALYDTGALTAELLDAVMTPYKHSDCDSGGSYNLVSKDGLGVEEIICKIMKPEEYAAVKTEPKWFEGEGPGCVSHHPWFSNEKAQSLFWSIWSGMWDIC